MSIHTTNWTKDSKTSTNWTKDSRISAKWDRGLSVGDGFLLQESGDYLLLETGGKIIIEVPVNTSTSWTKESY
jgi:hypothetical protein